MTIDISAVDRPDQVVDRMLEALVSLSEFRYGESVDMLAHSLQAAAHASDAAAGDELVVAALLHDIGHLVGETDDLGNVGHAATGAHLLAPWFPDGVAAPIRLHVDAKRYLVATEPGYAARLSPASTVTLQQQGGPMGDAEIAEFAATRYAMEAVGLRRWDDDGKSTSGATPSVESFRPQLLAVARTHRDDRVLIRRPSR